MSPNRFRSCKGDHTGNRVLHERISNFVEIGNHDIQQAFRETCFLKDLGDQCSPRDRSVVVRFKNDTVSRSDRSQTIRSWGWSGAKAVVNSRWHSSR